MSDIDSEESSPPSEESLELSKNKSTKRRRPGRKSRKSTIKFHSALKEDHKGQIYTVTFSPFTAPDTNPVFATVGLNGIRVYECQPDKTVPLMVFEDPDESEILYTSAWGILNNETMLAFAGMHGPIRVLNLAQNQVIRHLMGHGSSINELQFHPIHRELLTTASKDRTLHTWDIVSEVQVFHMGGIHGHQDEVLSCDFSKDGAYLATAGMDHAVIVWEFSSERSKLAIKAASVFDMRHSLKRFPTVHITPVFSTRDVHSNYIDCIRWLGDFLVSKSCEDEIKCWEPDLSRPEEIHPSPPIKTMMSFPVIQCPNWYVRFGIDRSCRYMGVGNQVGKIFIWDMDDMDSTVEPKLTIHHPKIYSQCRQVAFSNDSRTLVAVYDDSSLWRFSLKHPDNIKLEP